MNRQKFIVLLLHWKSVSKTIFVMAGNEPIKKSDDQISKTCIQPKRSLNYLFNNASSHDNVSNHGITVTKRVKRKIGKESSDPIHKISAGGDTGSNPGLTVDMKKIKSQPELFDEGSSIQSSELKRLGLKVISKSSRPPSSSYDLTVCEDKELSIASDLSFDGAPSLQSSETNLKKHGLTVSRNETPSFSVSFAQTIDEGKGLTIVPDLSTVKKVR